MPPSSVKTLDGVFAPEREGEVIDDRAHLPALDGLRGVAVLLVVMLHLTMQIHNPSGVGTFLLKRIFFFGWSGVDLFFVLSGFLITGILDDAKGTTNYFRVFYARRMLRILPLYYGALLVVFVTPYLVQTPEIARFLVPLKDQLWYWFYLQNVNPLPQPFVGLIGHFWTLAIEEQFYLVWPVVILLLSRKTALWVCAAILPFSIAYRTFTSYVIPELGSYTDTFAHLDGLAVGSALALLYRAPGATDWIKRRLPLITAVSVAAMLILYTGRVSALRPARHVLLGTFVALTYGSLLVHAVEQRHGPLVSFLRSKIMRFFGRYSYGMYVVHVPLISIGVNLTGLTPARLRFFGSELTGALLFISIFLPLVTIAAWISYNFYEKRFLRLKRRFVYRRPLKAVPHSEREPALPISV
jgi:peptidoglycan/LPS O-acetylase OafA/YrhL